MKKLLTALAIGLVCTGTLAESMYRWTDDRGGIQFGQQPPADRPFQRVDIKASAPPGGVLRQREPEITQPETANTQDERQPPKANEEQRALDCQRLAANLQTLENNPRLSRTNSAGEQERIGEDERQNMILQTRQDLDTHCN